MKLKLLLFFAILTILIIIGIVAISSKKGQQISTPVAEKNIFSRGTQRVSSQILKEYKDPSGFEFKHPDSAGVAVIPSENQSVFSSLKLTSEKYHGNILIEVVSSDLKSVDDWLNKNKINSSSKIKLADLDARQFKQNAKVVTVAVDIGTLFIITVDQQKNKEFWLDVNKKIVSSFAFQPPETSFEDTPISEESDVIFEGEETVE